MNINVAAVSRRIGLLLFMGLLFLLPAYSQIKRDISADDGTEWISDSSALKIGFVKGFLAGIGLMNEQAIQTPLDRPEDLNATKDSVNIEMAFATADDLSLYNVTVGQLCDGIDAFYKDFSTRIIKVIDAIYVAKKQINGADPDVISAQIRFLKLQPINYADTKAVWAKIKESGRNFIDALNAGNVSAEELLKMGFFVKDKQIHPLFCYGDYEPSIDQ